MFYGPAPQSPKGTICPWIRPIPLSTYWALFGPWKLTIVENRFLASPNKSLPHAQSRREKMARVGLTFKEPPTQDRKITYGSCRDIRPNPNTRDWKRYVSILFMLIYLSSSIVTFRFAINLRSLCCIVLRPTWWLRRLFFARWNAMFFVLFLLELIKSKQPRKTHN
jgi:hypothetical protein